MSYTNEILDNCKEIIATRKFKAETLQQKREEEVKVKVPNIAKYLLEMSKSGLAVMKAIGMGENAENYIKELSEINLKIQKCIKDELIKAGYPADYLETPYTCKKCNDTGFDGIYSCSCRNSLLKKLNLEELYKVSTAEKCKFDNFDLSFYPDEFCPDFNSTYKEKMQEIFNYCKDWAEDFDIDSPSLFLHGATGLGKTHLSLAMANVVAEKGYNIIYGSAQNLLSSLEREKFSNNNSGEQEAKILNCELLIIDDLGSEFLTSYTLMEIYNIINTRINTSRPVIISTNLTEEEIEKKYTQRVLSRIMGDYVSLKFAGRDIRQIKNNF